MQIEIKIDSSFDEPKLIICTDSITDEITELMQKLQESSTSLISGFQGEELKILEPTSIYRFYTANQKVYAITAEGEYTIRLRLYELEERLKRYSFIRISNTEIINMNMVDRFDLSFSGTICVKLKNKECCYVSRRYVLKIRQILGLS